MPLITPPSDEPFEPEKIEEQISQQEAFERYRRAMIYRDCLNWKCPECNCVVFGRCLTCPACRSFRKITHRPKDYKVHADD